MSVNYYRQGTVNRRFGFTLVELLVVISIIAILLAVLIPALSAARRQATRIICCTYMRSIHSAAMLYANDDRKGRLPQGGYHRIESNGGIIDRDDAIGMLISDFFRLSKYIVSMQNLPTEYDTIMRLPSAERARLADICIKDGGGKVFICPEMFKIKDTILDQLRRRYVTKGEVYFSSPVDYARIGYCYLGGFETEKWNYTGFAGLSNPNVEKWSSPMTLASKGDAVLITDRTRYVPMGENWNPNNCMDYQHSPSGYKLLNNVGADFKHTKLRGGINVGTFDGAIKFRTFPNTKMRQMYNDTYNSFGGGTGLNHQDYTFF